MASPSATEAGEPQGMLMEVLGEMPEKAKAIL
jgi:hypothetical protein